MTEPESPGVWSIWRRHQVSKTWSLLKCVITSVFPFWCTCSVCLNSVIVFFFLPMEEIRQDLELLTVEDLVVGIYQQKFLKEPSKTWVRSLLDVAMWDYSSNTRYFWWFCDCDFDFLDWENMAELVFPFLSTGSIFLWNFGIIISLNSKIPLVVWYIVILSTTKNTTR